MSKKVSTDILSESRPNVLLASTKNRLVKQVGTCFAVVISFVVTLV